MLQHVFPGEAVAAVARQNAAGVEELAVIAETASELDLRRINLILKQKKPPIEAAELIRVSKIPVNHMGKYDRQLLKSMMPQVTSSVVIGA